jgi:DNA-binding CsgD family transcriptional regulator
MGQPTTLLLAVADLRKGERIAAAARLAGWSVRIWTGAPAAAGMAEPGAADLFIYDEAHARWLRRGGRAAPAATRLLLLDPASPSAPAWASGVDAYLFEGAELDFAPRIALAQAGYSCVPERLLPGLLADDLRLRRLSQLDDAQRRLAEMYVHAATLKALAERLGQSPRATRAAVRRLLRALALPSKVNLAALFARAQRPIHPPRRRTEGSETFRSRG